MKLGDRSIGLDQPLLLIAGPCAAESQELCLEIAGQIKEIAVSLGLTFVFKASYDKANRTSSRSPRGPGLKAGLKILQAVRAQIGVPVLTDVHAIDEIAPVAEVVDVLQTPAFLCRQTDFIQAVAASGKAVNIKKGQFLAPEDMINVVAKAKEANGGADTIMVCERGVSFGYHNLISDMRALAIMRATGCPVIFDATHSVQQPGGLGHASGGRREFVPVLARAAVAAGISGLFLETHPRPDEALSDGPNSWPLARLAELLAMLVELHEVRRRYPLSEAALMDKAMGGADRRADGADFGGER